MLILRLSAKGRQVGRLELPAPPEERGRQLEAIQERPLSVCGVESPIPALDWQLSRIKLDDTLTLQKLNQLAETVDGMNAAGLYHLSKSLDFELQQSLDDVLRIASHVKEPLKKAHIKRHEGKGRRNRPEFSQFLRPNAGFCPVF